MTASRARRPSLRRQLLLGILLPVLALVAFNTVSLYRQALRAADTAYDRTLLASAKSIGELLRGRRGAGPRRGCVATVPYSALEAFEADNRSRMFFKVTGFQGEMVSGFDDLPPWRGTPARPQRLRGAGGLLRRRLPRRRRCAWRCCCSRWPAPTGQGMATIQVAETLELRRTLARQHPDRHAVAPGGAAGA